MSYYPRVAQCSSCGAGITRFAKLGRCRTCSLHRAHTKARIEKPEIFERLHRENLSRGLTPEVTAKRLADKEKIGRAVSRTKLAWIPDEWFDEFAPRYRALTLRGNSRTRLKAAEGRAVILREIAEREAMKIDIEQPIDFLRHRFSISRTDNGFRVGTAVLTRAELIEKARVFGWREAA